MTAAPQHVPIAIVGAGFGGLGTAIRLLQSGRRDFVILERASDVGGVWRDNSYPGCACDVQSHLYSFSFAPNPEWTRRYAPQAEIWEYLRECARRFDLLPHIRFDCELREASWDEGGQKWRLETSTGPMTAEVVVAGVGALSDPAVPALPGLEQFRGRSFHSARWDHGYDLTGRRVAVIGTGASAIQFVPQIQPRVAKLNLYQRTPAWVMPRLDRPVPEGTRRLLRDHPLALAARRAFLRVTRELLAIPLLWPVLGRLAQKIALRHLHRSVKDPALRAKLTPAYDIGCKRILLADDYYPAVAKRNVEVVTDAIREIRAHSIVTADGTERETDAIIFGTGFQIADLPIAKRVRGRDGRTLAEMWAGSPTAHLGTTVAGYPNFFILQGPNTGLGHTSVILMIESQIEHILAALAYMRAHDLAAVEPRREAQAEFVARVDARMRGTVWTAGGCKSWYLDKSGRNFTLWPGFTFSYHRRVRRFRPAEYVCEQRRDEAAIRGAA